MARGRRIASQVEVDAVLVGQQVELDADVALGEPVHDIGKGVDAEAAMTGGKRRDRSHAERCLVDYAECAVAGAERMQQVFLLLRDAHQLAGCRDDFHADDLAGEVGGLVADTRTHAGRGERATKCALHLVVVADEFESVLGELGHQCPQPHAGLGGDGVVVGVDACDAV